MKSYYYQYETSPRKLKPEYSTSQKTKKTTTTNTNKNTKKIDKNKANTNKKKNVKKLKTSPKQTKEKVSNTTAVKFSIFLKCFLIFLVFFLVIYRNSLITQSFAEIQRLKTEITRIQKENNQLEINIQNSINTNKIEQAAKEILGMQKLSNRQIVYISLSKKDFIEPRTEEIIIPDNTNILEKIIEKIKNLF